MAVKKLTDKDIGKKVKVLVQNKAEDTYSGKIHSFDNTAKVATLNVWKTFNFSKNKSEHFVNVPYEDLTLDD